MASISVVAVIRRRKEIVYQALKDIEKFPSFMKGVKEIWIRNSNGNRMTSLWKIDVDGTPIEWAQETILDDLEKKSVRFKMIEGDYDKYEGEWLLEEKEGGITRVELHAVFDWGVPGLERFVGKVLEEKARLSLKGMLFAIRKELHRR